MGARVCVPLFVRSQMTRWLRGVVSCCSSISPARWRHTYFCVSRTHGQLWLGAFTQQVCGEGFPLAVHSFTFDRCFCPLRLKRKPILSLPPPPHTFGCGGFARFMREDSRRIFISIASSGSLHSCCQAVSKMQEMTRTAVPSRRRARRGKTIVDVP